jgi:autotransporter-associated beta strand protein
MLWWHSALGQLFVYYQDATSNQWVGATAQPQKSAASAVEAVAKIRIDGDGNVTIDGDVTFTGNLTVNGVIRARGFEQIDA